MTPKNFSATIGPMAVEVSFNVNLIQAELDSAYKAHENSLFPNDGAIYDKLLKLYKLRHFLRGTEKLIGLEEHVLSTPQNEKLELSYITFPDILGEPSTVGVDISAIHPSTGVELFDFERMVSPKTGRESYKVLWQPRRIVSMLTGEPIPTDDTERGRMRLPLDNSYRRIIFERVYEANESTPIEPPED